MNVHYKWMVLLAVAASRLLSHACPIVVNHNSEQEWTQGFHSLGLQIGEDKDKDKDDRPGHSHDFGNHDSDRGLNGHHGPPHDNHGQSGDNDCHHRDHHGDGWIDTHLGGHDKINPVSDSGSSAILLGATLLGFLALYRNSQPKLVLAKNRSVTRLQ
jgi:hypothetical protein